MRFYQSFPEAINEITRDVKEMGILIKNKSAQNLDVSEDPNYEFYEVTNYTYSVTSPDLSNFPQHDLTWCLAEFEERVSGKGWNPGHAWSLRRKYWQRFLTRDNNFDYTYSERMRFMLRRTIDSLKQDLNTRRAFLPIFEPMKDYQDHFEQRIPCSLGYWFAFRQGSLQMTYLQRSADLSEHFRNDIWLARRLQEHVAEQLKVSPGVYTHWLGSLHCFRKDVAGVF